VLPGWGRVRSRAASQNGNKLRTDYADIPRTVMLEKWRAREDSNL
jgi:hypothetical protein